MTMLDALADAVVEWHDREWPSPDGKPAETERVAMKLTEEVGELHGALVKHLEGRTDSDWLAEAEQEFGDVLIVLCVLASRIRSLAWEDDRREHALNVTVTNMLEGRWMTVRERRGAAYRSESQDGEASA